MRIKVLRSASWWYQSKCGGENGQLNAKMIGYCKKQETVIKKGAVTSATETNKSKEWKKANCLTCNYGPLETYKCGKVCHRCRMER